ncbi:MAG: tRNA 2-thiouridine(34) synthase MnmA [Patescibacteria group bacterium]|nr:tRNA 2-thiouridine(34) synthase MnmA [Patescibacteria group bacterium]
MNKKKLKIAVAMSGGVDSAVAAKLLKDQGHEVAGIFLHFWKEKNPPIPTFPPFRSSREKADSLSREERTGEGRGGGCSRQALLDAKRTAVKIGIPLYVLDFAEIFKKQVVNNFLFEYANGRTPNPCVRCNQLVKLGQLMKELKKLGFDYLATGHYAGLRRELPSTNCQLPKNTNTGPIYKLYKAKDRNKDQSYFLYKLNQDELSHLLFPLANYTKPQVRRLAKKFKLPVAAKPDSQEVCFIPDKDHNEFLKRHLKLKPGLILSSPRRGKGEVLGQHAGLPLYTVGQRRGINIGGSGPFYAAKMDYKSNTLYVVKESDHPGLYSSSLIAGQVNWLAGVAPIAPLSCQAIIRYRQQPVQCVVTKIKRNIFQVKFARPQRAVMPGQSVVLCRGREVLGGGVIEEKS